MPTRKRIPARPRRLTVGHHYYDQRLDGERVRPRTVPIPAGAFLRLQQAGFAARQHCAFMRLAGRWRLVVVPSACYNPASFVIAAQERGVTHGLTQLFPF